MHEKAKDLPEVLKQSEEYINKDGGIRNKNPGIQCLMKRLRGDRVVLTEEGRKLLEWNKNDVKN